MAKIIEFMTLDERRRRSFLQVYWESLIEQAKNYDDWRQDIEIAEHELHQPFEDIEDE